MRRDDDILWFYGAPLRIGNETTPRTPIEKSTEANRGNHKKNLILCRKQKPWVVLFKTVNITCAFTFETILKP